ncbi:MAG: NAD-binding protein, partial [Gammaproteobacteria bacterium]
MKRIAIFGDIVMSLEVMRRLDKEQCTTLYLSNNGSDTALVSEEGYETAIIDFRDDDALRSIGIGDDIDVLFCFFKADSDNVFLTISARSIDRNLIIISIVDAPDSAGKLMAAGADRIIDPYEICGRKTFEILTKPEITHILDQTVFGRHDLNIAQIEIPDGSWLENMKTGDLKLDEKHNLILIGVVDKELDNEMHFSIGEKEHHLDAGDILVLMGPAREIRAFKRDVGLKR